jgi:hypothetical protein
MTTIEHRSRVYDGAAARPGCTLLRSVVLTKNCNGVFVLSLDMVQDLTRAEQAASDNHSAETKRDWHLHNILHFLCVIRPVGRKSRIRPSRLFALELEVLY